MLSILVEGQLYQNYVNERALYTPVRRLKMVRLAPPPPNKKNKTTKQLGQEWGRRDRKRGGTLSFISSLVYFRIVNVSYTTLQINKV